MNWLYLVHFTDQLHHAGHYLGACHNLHMRLVRHHTSEGSRLLEVCNDAGITWSLARAWKTPDAFKIESRLKRNGKNSRLYCPICMPRVKHIRGVPDFPLHLLSFHPHQPFSLKQEQPCTNSSTEKPTSTTPKKAE